MKSEVSFVQRSLAAALVGFSAIINPSAFGQTPTAPGGPAEFAASDSILENQFLDRPDVGCDLPDSLLRGDYSNALWPNGRVPYEFSPTISPGQRSAMLAAMRVIDDVTANIDFVARNGESAYLYIQDSNANNAPVGFFDGPHIVNIYNWNMQFVMVHELMHTLGIQHEQSRPDRDSYVHIESSHIQAGAEANFAIAIGSITHGPYDFDSIMHYSACSFSVCGSCDSTDASCRTITVLPPYDQQWQSAIGQHTHMSSGDIAVLRYLYDGFPNDTCAAAIPIQDGTTRFLSTGAGMDSPPSCSGRVTASLWYTYTANVTGTVTAFTCASSFDTLLSAYSGNCGSLTQIACNDDAGGGQCSDPYQSMIQFAVSAGQSYKIRVGGYDGATGRGFLFVSTESNNAFCDGSIEIVEGTTSFSTLGVPANEVDTCTGTNSAARWFVFWPARSGRYLIDTCGSNFDTTVAVSYGPCNAITSMACNDDALIGACPNTWQSALEVSLTGGLGYRIRVAGFSGETGTGVVNIRWFPENDRCNRAISIGDESVLLNPSGAGLSDAICTDLAPTGLWYLYTASCNGIANANTCGSMIDTVLSVAQGNCNALTPIGCNDDLFDATCDSPTASEVSFPVVVGSTYLIRVGGYGGIGGPCVLTLSCTPNPCPSDINGDRHVDLSDLSILLAHFGLVGGQTLATGDLNHDGNVELSDLAELLSAFGIRCD